MRATFISAAISILYARVVLADKHPNAESDPRKHVELQH